jgi:regulator of sigma E protease
MKREADEQEHPLVFHFSYLMFHAKMLTAITIIIFLSILILIHELGHFLLAKRFGLFVSEFGLGLPPRAWGKKVGETIYGINWLPFGGYVKIAGEDGDDESNKHVPKERIFGNIAAWKRFCILVGGVGMNFLLGWMLLSIVFMIGVKPGVFISQVQKDGPASIAGLKANDLLLDFKKSDEFVGYTKIHAGESIAVRVERGGKEMTLQMTPRKNPPAGQGPLGVVLGESLGHNKQGVLGSLKTGFTESIGVVEGTFKGLAGLIGSAFAGKGSLENVAGPIGIIKISVDASNAGFIYILSLMAIISINLAAFNILPFPALDGGRVLFLLIEKLKGSPLPQKFEQYANGIGLMLLLGLILVVSVKDVIRFF